MLSYFSSSTKPKGVNYTIRVNVGSEHVTEESSNVDVNDTKDNSKIYKASDLKDNLNNIRLNKILE